MAIGLNSLLNIGNGALFASQAAINVTGNNIANVDNQAYSRQAVRLEANHSIDFYPGQIGQGVTAAEVYRYFDRFIEKSYLDKYSSQNRYETQNGILRSIENIFNETNSPGISSLFDKFLKDWQQIAQRPDDMATRSALLANTSNFTKVIRDTDLSMVKVQREIDKLVEANVEEANKLIQQIADLNKQIQIHNDPGKNNANSLMDARDEATRKLSSIIDIDVIDRGGGNYSITTRAGKTLVNDSDHFGLVFKPSNSQADLMPNSAFTGNVTAVGDDYNEYTLEITQAIDNSTVPPTPAQFRVSLDGGRTWLRNDDGSVQLFDVTDKDSPVRVHNIEVSFSENFEALQAGDKFTVMPKSGVYYDHPTKGLENITPMIMPDGSDREGRMTGGAIAGLLITRDYEIGKIRDKLQAFAQSLTWEVNRLHSQGTGTEKLSYLLGTYQVRDSNIPLGSDASTLAWRDRLNQLANVQYNATTGQVESVKPGNVTFFIYDKTTGDPIMSKALDFSHKLSAFGNGFDPTIHSLDDVATAINNSFLDPNTNQPLLNAAVVDGRLQINPTDPNQTTFGMVDDTSGILAALGVNTFFSGGENPQSLAIRDEIGVNLNLINAARINGGAEANGGDNITAKAIGDLASTKVSIRASFERPMSQTLGTYYNGIVAQVGANTSAASFNAQMNRTMASDLDSRQEEIRGVNLDEEMANLIKYQSSYKAAAKLITTADQMLQTVLSLKN
ncbi:flagellar hook-associated protein FlgK [Desulfovibrio litoralis]|uniref:Flagellar hook-associated protein 1 n=1 Tax=Desulfovibrio litoralis DSM 11393 TaxID=1121455 RepID=A0A1M7TF97_9BACT|nr:flagellar hook-associated protein FlgK [Desulfovibrio litoralis]SHN69429.1 flagellar hook-associated protein 1 FlgK [Desulfovibrio litoralis DSM 11393]